MIIENKNYKVQRNNDILQELTDDNMIEHGNRKLITKLVPDLNQLKKLQETNLNKTISK